MKHRFSWLCESCGYAEDRWMTSDSPKRPRKCPECGARGALKRDYSPPSVVADDYGKDVHLNTLMPTLAAHERYGHPVVRNRSELREEMRRQREVHGHDLEPNFPV